MGPTSHFDQLLQAAAAQPEPQRLLFLFATAGLPDDATPAQRRSFDAGSGGELVPTVCVDKSPHELAGFDALVADSLAAGPPWQVVFAAGLSGQNGSAPTGPQVDAALEAMVERLRTGRLDGMLALDRSGAQLQWC